MTLPIDQIAPALASLTAAAAAAGISPSPAAPAPSPTAGTEPMRATFKNVTAGAAAFPVHFNPVSLQISLSNTLDEKGSGKDKKQYVSKSSSKLTMDLIFDTTTKGTDVRNDTSKVAAFMEGTGSDETHRAPPTVLFEWGTFKFQGIFESYRETIDFFSHDGVPLRASVNLTMSRQTVVFTEGASTRTTDVAVPAAAGNASQIAARSGNPNGGRGLATANGLESMRFSTGPLSVSVGVKLGGPVAFASGGAGIRVSAGIGIGVGASAGASLSLRGPSIGGSASAGVSATAGAFAGLRSGASVSGPALDPTRLLPPSPPRVVDIGPQASFGIGGQAQASGSASLTTDVGASVSAQARVRFD